MQSVHTSIYHELTSANKQIERSALDSLHWTLCIGVASLEIH